MIDFLKSKKFVFGIRPRVEMRTIWLAGHEIDVLIIKNSIDTPYFLTEDFPNVGRRVRANHIYPRVGDTNRDLRYIKRFKQIAEDTGAKFIFVGTMDLTDSMPVQILRRNQIFDIESA